MPGETCDEVRGRPPADARLDELGDCRERIRLGRVLNFGRADDDRDLAARSLGEAPGELLGAPANDLLEALRQLAADRDRTGRQSLGERAETGRQAGAGTRKRPARRAIRRAPPREQRAHFRCAVGIRRTGTAPRRARSRRAPFPQRTGRAARSPSRPRPARPRSAARPGRSPRAGLRRSSARPAHRPRAWAAPVRSARPRCARGS